MPLCACLHVCASVCLFVCICVCVCMYVRMCMCVHRQLCSNQVHVVYACNRVHVCMSTVLTVFEPVLGTGQCIMSVHYVCQMHFKMMAILS